MKAESFKSRYLIKVASSIIIAIVNIIIQMLLPRAFSVEEFGYYSYNLNLFTSVVSLANLSTSNALVAKFSKRNGEIGLVYFYLCFYAVEVILLSSAVIFLFPTNFMQTTFVGQTLMMVILGLETAAIIKFLADVVSIYDSMAIAKVSAIFQIVLKVSICLFVIGLYFVGQLNLFWFYVGQIIITVIIAFILLFLVLRYQRIQYPEKNVKKIEEYIKEYTIFCRPLVISSIIAQVITIVMNWCLMRFSGATEQAMFGVAWQLNTLVTYIFAPYAELSKREYSILSNDKNNLQQFYESSLKRMIWLTAYFACFIGFCSDWFVRILYGDRYTQADFVTLLIMIYTVYQAWGQMSGAFMLATERTKMNATLGILGQIFTIGLVFLFQIPNVLWPNGLGAIGIALVYVLQNFIGVTLSVAVTSYALDMQVVKIMMVQVAPLSICSLLSFGLNKGINLICNGNDIVVILLKVLSAGIIYTMIVGIIIFVFPSFISMDRHQIKKIFKRQRG